MSKWTVLDWDLSYPIHERLQNHKFKRLNLATVGVKVQKALGGGPSPPAARVQPGKPPPFARVRV